ncbi:hypothetical protein [Alteraurantiacibacter buctensis]|uniref:Uncharacterized protein n=1 Tax=Alteraurantiacibacter buctensis TaxID=1503981 RepID=A0A844Z2Y4_9SPHN|nr:hypothetical protein [Alteraurantiacibacter buctensis]MXO72877.1 hypothetical protein [Alteraurantiacibacter buctensis]
MRNALTRLALWLVRRLGINVLEQTRLNTPADAVARGQRWEAFYHEEGGLADMIARLRQDYFEAASAVGHRDNDKLYEFAVADRMAREIEREVVQIIYTGKAEVERRAAVERENSARILRAL